MEHRLAYKNRVYLNPSIIETIKPTGLWPENNTRDLIDKWNKKVPISVIARLQNKTEIAVRIKIKNMRDMQSVNHLSNANKRPRNNSRRGKRYCITCRKIFLSPDKVQIQICDGCKLKNAHLC